MSSLRNTLLDGKQLSRGASGALRLKAVWLSSQRMLDGWRSEGATQTLPGAAGEREKVCVFECVSCALELDKGGSVFLFCFFN